MSVMVLYGSRLAGATPGTRVWTRWFRNPLAPILYGLLAMALVLSPGAHTTRGAESNAPPLSLSVGEITNLQQVLGACLQIQDQLQAARMVVEQSRAEAQTAATQNAEALAGGLQGLRAALAEQRKRELEAVQQSNKAMLLVAGTFAGIGLLALLLLTYLQWRMSRCLADISSALPTHRGLGLARETAALGLDTPPGAASDPAARSNLRLLRTLDQLDKRIDELRNLVHADGNGDPGAPPDDAAAGIDADPSPNGEQTRIPVLLNQAQSLMNLGNAEAAVGCLDEVLALEPNHTEALVKKGAALERLHKLNEAIDCYDRAIAVDSSMTTAYLHKGGLCNRLERFKEALQCYEKALRTHEQRGS